MGIRKINFCHALVLTSSLTVSCAQAEPLVMGYWENWDTYNNFPMPNNAQGATNSQLSTQLTQINALAYAFLEVAQDGTVQFNDTWSDLAPNNPTDKDFCQQSPMSCPNYPAGAGLGNFYAFTQASVSHHVVSIGGAGHDVSWQAAFANPNTFVASLQKLVNVYHVDALDIDYEPLGGVPSEQSQNFISLVKQLHQAMPSLLLTYAVPANGQVIRNFGADNWQKLAANLSYIDVMGYDMHGAFDQPPLTGLQSALTNKEGDYSDEIAIQALEDMGISHDKIVLGVPFYGRAVGGVSQNGLGQSFTQSYKGDLDLDSCSLTLQASNMCSGMIQYKSLLQETVVPFINEDVLAGVYANDSSKAIFVSYENPDSIKAKAQYTLDHQLGGMMAWALRFDTTGNNSLLSAMQSVLNPLPPAAVGSVSFINNNQTAISLAAPLAFRAIEIDSPTQGWITTDLLPSTGQNSVTMTSGAFGNYTGRLQLWTAGSDNQYVQCSEIANYSPTGHAMKIYGWHSSNGATDCAIEY